MMKDKWSWYSLMHAREESELVLDKKKGTIEAAELTVHKEDSITPTKLVQLGVQGWTIIDAMKLNDGGFRLLLTRTDSVEMIEEEEKKEYLDYHVGGMRCPAHCDCAYRYGKTVPILT